MSEHNENEAYKRCEQAQNAFYRHAQTCGICRQAQPDPESCDDDQLCRSGLTMRQTWERTEESYQKHFGE